MKKLIAFAIVAFAIVTMLGSCGSYKQVAYFQNIDSLNLSASKMLYDATIKPKDQLSIIVKTTDEKVSEPFNIFNSKMSNMGGQNQNLQSYLVDNNGDIEFPVVGKIHVLGLTSRQCEELIRAKISPYLAATEHPLVTVRLGSFRVVVLGEVGSPGAISVPYEKMSVVEAIAQSGDLGLQGKRKNILLIREDATGMKSAHRMDLTDANIINSPYYYLQQNDIVYVQPNSVKAKNSAIGSSTTIWFSFVSIATSLASLLINVLRN